MEIKIDLSTKSIQNQSINSQQFIYLQKFTFTMKKKVFLILSLSAMGIANSQVKLNIQRKLDKERISNHQKLDQLIKKSDKKLSKYYSDNKQYQELVDLGIECSSKTMYPDWIGKNHRREGKFITPMGCRAFLSDYRDENGELIFEGRFNLGAVSLNLPMIYMKAKKEKLDYYETLNYYLELIRKLHIKRFEYVGKAKANSNPLMFTQGGAYGGYLNPEDDIKPLLKSATISFGITALHELLTSPILSAIALNFFGGGVDQFIPQCLVMVNSFTLSIEFFM